LSAELVIESILSSSSWRQNAMYIGVWRTQVNKSTGVWFPYLNIRARGAIPILAISKPCVLGGSSSSADVVLDGKE
jgi:hypothetical protein